MLVRNALHRDARKLPLAREVENIIRRQSLVNNGVWYDPSDFSTLFQDAAGTIPVTAAGQPVGKILDKSGRGNHATQTTAGYKPLLQSENGLNYLAFDGLDDFLVTGNIDFSSTDKIAVAAGVRKLSDAAIGALVEFSSDINTNSAGFGMYLPTSASITGRDEFSSKGSLRASAQRVRLAPYSAVMAGVGRVSLDVCLLRSDGVEGAQSPSDQGTGNYGNYPLYIGRRGGTSLPFNGRLYGLAICGGMDDIYKLKKIEQYLAKKTGVII